MFVSQRGLCICLEDAQREGARAVSVANRLKKCIDSIGNQAANNNKFIANLKNFEEQAQIEGQRADKELKGRKAELEKSGYSDNVCVSRS